MELTTMPTYNLETITPQEAARILDKLNTENWRKLRPQWVAELANIIKRGDWRDNPLEPIGFAKEGVQGGALIEGQHRLAAVVMAGREVQMWVCRGVDAADAPVLDSGHRRSSNDDLRREGVNDSSAVATALNLYWHWERGEIKRATSRTDRQTILRLYGSNQDIEDSLSPAIRLAEVFPGGARGRRARGGYAFLHYAASREDKNKANEFFNLLSMQVLPGDLPTTSPIHPLRTDLVNERLMGVRALAAGGANRFFHAWRSWLQDLPLKETNPDREFEQR
jgi:hypothetical protein